MSILYARKIKKKKITESLKLVHKMILYLIHHTQTQLELYIVDLIKNAFPDFQYSMSWFHLKMNARKQKSNSSSKVLKSFE